jgi:membrane protease YdiL (CAAX protease family)
MDSMQDNSPSKPNFAVMAAIFEGSLAIFALLLGWLFGIAPLANFHWSWLDLLWGVIATLPPLALFAVCLYLPWRPFRRILQLMHHSILPLFRECAAREIAVISLLAGLGEELLFRSIVQAGFSQWLSSPYGTLLGLCAAAIIFALLHPMTFTYSIIAGVIGLYLGVIWLLTGNLLVPITTHALYDFLAITAMLRMQNAQFLEENDNA